MSITFKSISLKNFLSVGNVTQAVNLENSNLTLVLGENLDLGGDGHRNGVGKTALIQAISYALFGVPINNIRKDNLVNRTNGKNMLVALDFNVNGIDYKIERGRKPNILKFYVNDVQQKQTEDQQGENKETQVEIEKIICMTSDMFCHIVALNTYTEPFLALRANEQRNIIEQLLGITILSEKAEIVKELIRQSKDDIQQEEFKLKAIEEANKRVKEQIENLKRRQVLWQKKHNDDLEKLVNTYNTLSEIDIEKELENHVKLTEYNKNKEKLDKLENDITQLKLLLAKEEKLVKKLEKEIETLDSHKCYACGQDFHDEQHTTVLNNKKLLLEESIAEYKKFKDDLFNKQSNVFELGEMPITHYKTEVEAVKHSSQLENITKQIEDKTNEINPYSEQITDMENQALQEINFDKLNEFTKTLDHQKLLLDLLTNKDSFVRKKIIDQSLKFLNSRLEYYLNKVGLPHQVVFKNDLQVEITELGRELDFYNLSRGEMNRVILSLSWAFRDMWENLYFPINCLFIDELLDSGMDTMGIESSIGVLKDMTRRRGKNIWVVSHREDLSNRVNNVLKVIKENGFSTYSTTTEVEIAS